MICIALCSMQTICMCIGMQSGSGGISDDSSAPAMQSMLLYNYNVNVLHAVDSTVNLKQLYSYVIICVETNWPGN